MVMRFRSTPFDYRRKLPHLQRGTRPIFITFHTIGFAPLSPNARDMVFDSCLHEHGKRILMHAFVVMPEHVHLLLSPLCDGSGDSIPVQNVVQSIKSASVHKINRAEGRHGSLWDDESFDHLLRSVESLHEKREYIRANPVRRGLAARPEDYRWLWVNELDDI